MKYYLRLLIVMVVFLQTRSFAEGTKQLQPTAADWGFLQIFDTDDINRSFATYNASPENRLHIRISNIGEKIHFGFRQDNGDVLYRIKDPTGKVVIGPALLPGAGAGYIATHAQAVAGPNTITAGGYTPLSYTPLMTGDFYIEFNPDTNTVIDPVKDTVPIPVNRYFRYFDITVESAANQVISGRLWSQAWDINVRGPLNPFIADLYIYTIDRVVTKVDFNGMKPHGFVISSNSTGCVNTGNPLADRQSRAGNFKYPEYKIFLNDPDSLAFPSGVIGAITAPTTIAAGCPYCINVTVNSPGTAEVVLDLNGIPGYQFGTEDVALVSTVIPGSNCVSWNGKNGLGQFVPKGTNIFINVSYYFGLTNLPMYDAEFHPGGYLVTSVRPSAIVPQLHWDDSNIPAGTTNFVGCPGNLGCHGWPEAGAGFGNNRTINTWWFINVSTDNVFFTVPGIFSSTPTTTNDATCKGTKTGTATVTIAGGNPTYAWNTTPVQTTATATGLSAGTYTVVVTEPDCGIDSVTVTIAEPLNHLTASISNSADVNCFGGNDGSATVTASGGNSGYQYSWSTVPVQTVTTASGLTANVYTVTVTDAKGCDTSAIVTIAQPAGQLTVTIAQSTNVSCFGSNDGSAIVTASGGTSGYTYSWSTAPAQANDTAVGLSTGTYTVFVTDSKGCDTSAVVTISGSPAPFSFSLSQINVFCKSDSTGSATITASGGNTPYTYAWSTMPSQTTQTATGLKEGSYTITLTDAKGCDTSAVVTISGSPVPFSFSVSQTNVLCKSDSTGSATITASGGNIPYTYTWSTVPVQTIQTATGLKAGSFTITLTDAKGCDTSASVSITEPLKELSVSISSDVSCSSANSFNLLATAAGGVPAYTYAWSTQPQQTTANATGLPSGTYTVTVSDSNGCQSAASVSIIPKQLVNAGKDTIICPGDTVQLKGTGGLSYSWKPANTLSDSVISNPFAFPASTTTYYLNSYQFGAELISNGDFSLGASGFTSDYKHINNTPLLFEGTYTISKSPKSIHPAFSSCGDHTTGNGNMMIVNGDSVANKNIWCQAINVAPNTLYSFSTWIASVFKASPATFDFSINGISLGSPVSANTDTCIWDKFYQLWNSGVNTTANICIVNRNTSSFGNDFALDDISFIQLCPVTDSVTVEIHPPLNGTISSSASVCSGDSAIISGSVSGGDGNYVYSWDGLQANGTGPYTVSPPDTAQYIFNVTDGCAQTWKDSVVVYVYPNPQANPTCVITSAFTEQVITFADSSIDAVKWMWYFGDGDSADVQYPSHSYKEPGIYTITLVVENSYGCSDTAYCMVEIIEGIEVPNVFTPNGDGVNDEFHVKASGVVEYNISIYNRWGLKLFETIFSKVNWDGRTTSGAEAPEGTYYYILSAKFYSGNLYETKGHITLLR